ncbi:pyroglutamyl-peptidase I [Gallaecimonas pentaromativorans]|uniref:Pyroglutamyl-peptidase I n=1 Tax=Gallaecimonas pentaromativorans TaxID=584787 RepID=A0A3N1PMS8_9GAMM|nr:pyroglutamyl-peptidase I [Gallaecimonas pentaromativorans]ROQ30005.1 pyroglutamyl-peptidase [Gallaecimonas pentaromativorans]
MKILLTGFEPFGGEPINPSWEAVKALAGYRDAVVSLMLPCVFDKSLEVLGDVARALEPEIILSVGQAGGRSGISLEKVAINLNDARIPDNAGAQPVDSAVIEGAPNAYFASLPVKRLTAALKEKQIEAQVSFSAGTYVCNHVFFGACHLAQSLLSRPSVGFVHIPFLPEQAERNGHAPAMALAEQITALKVLIDALLAGGDELHTSAGTTH